MPHRYKVREIAQQSGLSEATVDRLPNWPPGVRENTRAEVMQATVDRDKQRCPAGPGRPSATSSTLSCGRRSGSPTPSGPRSRPNCVYSRLPWCPRFHLWELDAADGAGVTAAHLMNQWLGPASPDASITLSRTVFRGEGGPAIVEVSDSDGIDATNERLMFDALETHPPSRRCTPSAAAIRPWSPRLKQCRVFIAHDLDADNRRLLRAGRISVVLHNDLRTDARLAMRLILQERGTLPVEPSRPVPIHVITPYYLPR